MPTIENLLEALVDKHGLLHVLTALENICNDKAEHLAVNWQDVDTAKVWCRAADAINKSLTEVDV